MADIAFTPAGFVAGDPAKGARPSALTAIETVLNQIAHKASRGSGLLDADLVGGRDVLAQTPLNSGLICAPQANVPEWPDNAAGTTYFQDVFSTLDGWAGTRCTIDYTTKPGTLIVTATAANPFIYRAQWSGLTGKTIKAKIKMVSGSATHARFSNNTGTIWSQDISYDGLSEKIFSCVPSNGWFEAIYPGSTGSANLDVYEISFIYIGDGTYTTKALDASGNGTHGTIYGATPVDTVAGKGFSFDGVNDYLSSNNITCSGDYSVSMRLNPSSLSNAVSGIKMPFESGYGNVSGIRWFAADGSNSYTLSLFRSGGDEQIANSFSLSVGSESLITIVIKPSLKQYYVYTNGVLTKSGALTYTPVPPTNVPFTIGDSGYTTHYYFPGTIADPRIYNRALSAEEIWELYQKPGIARLSGPIDAVTAVPDSRVVRDANGMTEVAGLKFAPGTLLSAGTSTDPNTLDDYEEGTFVPGVAFGGASVGVTFTTQVGSYTKIGNRVFVTGIAVLSSKGSSTGSATLTGLPFVLNNNDNNLTPFSISINVITFADFPQLRGIKNTTTAQWYESLNTGARTDLTDTDFANASSFAFSGHYYV